MPSKKRSLLAASGAGGDSLYAEDVFSTYLYTGTGAARSIVNGIDLDGEGGLVWMKARSSSSSHSLIDTARGGTKQLKSDNANAEVTSAQNITAFNSNGFSLGDSSQINANTINYCSWTFRKAEKFFDVVTWTGNATAGRQIPHSLGSTPGFIITKRRDGIDNWKCYHVGNPSPAEDHVIELDNTNAAGNEAIWNDTAPTATNFTVSAGGAINGNTFTYVAYLFASDAGGFGDDEDESIIKCGSFTTGASGKMSSPVDCGFEPQWLLVKNSGGAENWNIYDTMRGLSVSLDALLHPNLNIEEDTGTKLTVTATGFDTPLANGPFSSGATYIYMAIRMSMKTPTAGTEVFSPVARTGTGTTAAVTGVGFSPDLFIGNIRDTAGYWNGVVDRLRGISNRLVSSQTEAENTQTVITSFDMDGLSLTSDGNGFANESGKTYIEWLFKRATGFMDVVAYTGNSAVSTVDNKSHNLGVVPELIIFKSRSGTDDWYVYHSALDETKVLYLNTTVWALSSTYMDNTAPTSSVFTANGGFLNSDGVTYVAYLFATLAGVSKVGSYTGTAASLDLDMGFAAGARFFLCKRTDASNLGDWYVYDSARGIIAGNDPYLLLNSTAAEVTGTDYVDPLAAGITLTAAGSSTINVSGATYIFLAIA